VVDPQMRDYSRPKNKGTLLQAKQGPFI